MDIRTAALSLVTGVRVCSLQSNIINTDDIEISGDLVPRIYHAGQSLVEEVTTDIFFEGWYGWGFYAAFDPEYVRRWYGPIVTELEILPEAKVLVGSVSAAVASPELIDKVMEKLSASESDEVKREEMKQYLMENHIMWVHALDEIAIQEYDVVIYSDEQIVVKNPDVVKLLGEVPDVAA